VRPVAEGPTPLLLLPMMQPARRPRGQRPRDARVTARA